MRMNRALQLLRDERGFTMIETLTALFVLAIGLFASFGLFDNSNRSALVAQRHEAGVQVAEQALEELRTLPYAQIAMAGTAPIIGGPTDPARRISAARFSVGGGLTEELVAPQGQNSIPAMATCDQTPASGTPLADPCERISIGSGTTAMTGRLYRFVSWRDEECPLVDLQALETSLTDLRTLLVTVAGPDGTLTRLAGPNGSLPGTISSLEQAINTANQADPISRGVLAPMLAILNPLLTNTVTPLYNTLQPMLAPLQAVITPLDQLLDPATGGISQRIDLCDLQQLVDLDAIPALKQALTQLAPVLAALQTPVNNVRAVAQNLASLSVGGLINALATTLTTLPPLVNALTNVASNLNNTLAGIAYDALTGRPAVVKMAQDARAAINALLTNPNTTHNTKRVTVAVVLDKVNGIAPGEPIWVSTVVTNPADGLL